MRYRINNYGLNVNNVNHRLMIYFDAPEGYIDEDSGKTLAEQMKEAVRLVVDETAKIVFTSSMQKDKILTIDTTTGQTGFGYRMIFDIPTGKTVTVNDLFTLEFDFGDAPGASPSADQLAEFFGVTLLQGYEFMTDTEVTDELEGIMQALDPELLQEVEYPEGSGQMITKAQFITIQAMEEVNNIINPSES